MEATEATANEQTLPAFVETMKLLASLDRAFSETGMQEDYIGEDTRFKDGRDIFTSAPASIAFSAAASQYLLGMPGYSFEFDAVQIKLPELKRKIDCVIDKIRSSSDKSNFIDYLTLNQKISARSGRIGEYEREFFFRAFSHMLAHAEGLQSLTPCWSAYK